MNNLEKLKEIMIALGERDRLVKLCKIIIDMQSQKCYVKENRVGGMET